MSARRVGIEVAAHKAHFIDATFQLSDDPLSRRHAAGLRQLTNADKVVRKHLACPVNQVVAVLRPDHVHVFVAVMMIHAHRAWRKHRQVNPSLFHDAQLIVGDPFANLFISDFWSSQIRCLACFFERFNLLRAKLGNLGWRGGEVAVNVDDHGLG